MSTSKIVNLTPHTLNIYNEGGEVEILTLESSGVARVAMERIHDHFVDDIPVERVIYGEVTGLPDQQSGVILVVSAMVAAASRRLDVYSPGELLRDESGKPIGCAGLTAPPQRKEGK